MVYYYIYELNKFIPRYIFSEKINTLARKATTKEFIHILGILYICRHTHTLGNNTEREREKKTKNSQIKKNAYFSIKGRTLFVPICIDNSSRKRSVYNVVVVVFSSK